MIGLLNLTSLSVECASMDWERKHFDWLDTQERKDQYLDLAYLLKSVGSQLQQLELRQVNETAYKQLIPNFHHLTALINFSIDINCSWDWDGNLTGGPLKMLEGSSLSRLTIRFQSCFGWDSISAPVRVFSNVDLALSIPNLTHLDVYEDDNSYLSKGQQRSHTSDSEEFNLERPRYGVGFHQFIAALPKLDTLWCTEYLLRPLKTLDDPDSWKGIASARQLESRTGAIDP
ncbi:hypothetical protein DL96DRAFT_1612240 [Flagelloscypha sp. PMI_526]|nr:hypothetical protein DL96DRAFT_1612240 [Flagelloscypha sp. PMI_526]